MRTLIRKVGWMAGVCMVLSVLPSGAFADVPEWLPGFPLRAGTIVVLRWSPIPGSFAYRAYRRLGGGEFRLVYTGPQTIFNDVDVSPSETVSYKVTATVEGMETAPSAIVTMKGVEPLKPPAFYGATYPAGAITIRWSTPPGTVFFNLYRSDEKTGSYTLLDSTHQDIYTDRNIKKGKTYYYKIAAIDGNNLESAASAPLEARLPPEVAATVKEKPVLRKVVPKGEFYGEEFYPLVQPSEIGFTPKGELYAMDRNSIQFFDLDGTYLRRVNFDRKWPPPSGLVLDRDGKFLVSFYTDNTVRKIDDEGKTVAEVNYPPTGTGIPNNPNNAAVCMEGYCWIADGSRYQVIKVDRYREKFETIGRLRGTYERKGKEETDLPAITRIQFNPVDKKLYVSLGLTAEIKVIDPKTSKVIKTFGGLGLENSKFQGIGGLSFRRNGNILVLDHLMQVIKEFDRNYNYVATYADIEEKDIVRLSSNLLTTFAFREETKRFYISSAMGNRIYKFDIAE
ncbi:MAG: S-layer protein [Actinobacteria bacterium]|nr:S-layer protein [Actinomycetota bacterium]